MAEKPLVLEKWQVGIGASPHVGFGDMRNLDISSRPGVIKINNPLLKKSSTTVVALITWFVRNPRNSDECFGLDTSGNVYRSADAGVSWSLLWASGSNGQGLTIWNDYLFVAKDSSISIRGPLSGSPSNTADWKSINSDTLWHPMRVSTNDGKLYGGAGRYIFCLEELTTFDPANAATYTFTAQALDLPKDYRIKCLEELGESLMIGTWRGTSIFQFKIADIFPWDRVIGDSYNIIVSLHDFGVNSMLNINNIIYVLAGIDGVIYSLNGVQATPISKIPNSICNLDGGAYIEPYPGALMEYKNRLFFGVNANGNVGGCGVWSLTLPEAGRVLNFEHIISTGNDGSANSLKIGALMPISRDTFLCGWQDNLSFGIDETDNTARYGSYSAYVECPIYQTGTAAQKRSFGKLMPLLARMLATGQGFKIKYRKNLSDSFTTIGTWDFATLGALMSGNKDGNIADAELLQIRIELLGASTTPEFRSLALL